MLTIKPSLDDEELKIYNFLLTEIGTLIEGQNEYVKLGKTAFDIHGRGYFFGYGIMKEIDQEKVEAALLQLPFIFVTEKNYKLMNKAHPTIVKFKEAQAQIIESKESGIRIVYLSANPFFDSIKLSIEVFDQSDIEFILSDLNGNILVHQKENSVNGVITMTFETSGLSSGIYFLRINSNRGDHIVKKLVKIS